MNGKRASGRQREKIWDGLGRWMGAGKVIDLVLKREENEI